ncbi:MULTISPECIES: ABC transporter substrate-binding protein [unclassified Chelatococcus]|jgi:NitT/TauT family transport system substrate-binding protein|uniref:ABC transporter substrate-binding protein n=1 Tax=unclassified Chelatococcus TaxID=2638111 RepID=UPI001BD06501|nr:MULTISPECIES: ABC transporter substrate-binding protein [unclassified Chelatococcus]CAH1651713.1 ABC-type nitrate/sulfonate/bicarbonate transport system substrate-binding protein [Hyphomicrobiales bacterium]MBS7743131.1 ABC transporter substrate-binding protein [Chelatococcus sp. HY11]MBX3541751.1 ABC transporter substrate-binding protein [Chelatococcus sp.]MCO5074357.1 ABC transporter substrate-binding protein [Chelatococcus sp.]CAH1693438.1 ABC-type nitrate/sulfonate/bicarbonate transport
MANKADFSRRSIMVAAGGIAAASFLPKNVYAQASMPELTTLRSTSKSWLWAAEDYATAAGFFTEARVKVNSNASNRGTNVAALQGGGVDIVLGDPGEVLRARTQNLQIRTFIATVNRYASHVLLKKDILAKRGVDEKSPQDKKVEALKGLKLGTTGPGAAPDALFRYLASTVGLDANKDFQLVPIQGGGPAILAALQQGVIEGFCLSSPTADMAVQKQDCGYLFQMALNPPAEMKEVQYIVASAGEATIAGKRDALERYTRGIALALRSIRNEPEKFKAWAKDWFEGLEPETFNLAFANNGAIYFEDPTPKRALLEKNIAFINIVNQQMGAPALPTTLTFETVSDPSIADAAMKGL